MWKESLEKLKDFKGKLPAPSIGITLYPEKAFTFGAIVLLGSMKMISDPEWAIFERDAWTPRLRIVSEKIYKFNVNALNEIPSYLLRSKIRRFAKDAQGEDNNGGDARDFMYDMIMNEYDVYKYFEDKGGDDYVVMIREFIEKAFPEVERSPENIVAEWNKKYPDLRGQDSNAWASAIAARSITITELKDKLKVMNKKFTDKFEQKMKERQWVALRALRRAGEGEDFQGGVDVQALGGAALKHGTFEGFNREMRAWGRDPVSEFTYKEIKEAVLDVPSEYFEAKARRVVHINEFSKAIVPSNDVVEITALLRLLGFTGPIVTYEGEKDEIKKTARAFWNRVGPIENPKGKSKGEDWVFPLMVIVPGIPPL